MQCVHLIKFENLIIKKTYLILIGKIAEYKFYFIVFKVIGYYILEYGVLEVIASTAFISSFIPSSTVIVVSKPSLFIFS